MNDLTFFQGAMLAIAFLGLIGFGALVKASFSLVYEFREWKGNVDGDRRANVVDHQRFDKDIDLVNQRIEGTMG